MKIIKVYTRRGDKGMTDLVGGVRISKTDVRLEAYGTVDELSSHLGLLAAMMPDGDELRSMVIRIQNNLFNVCTHLATDQSQTPLYPSAHLPEGETEYLEKCIDDLNGRLPVHSAGRNASGRPMPRVPHGVPSRGAPHRRTRRESHRGPRNHGICQPPQ